MALMMLDPNTNHHHHSLPHPHTHQPQPYLHPQISSNPQPQSTQQQQQQQQNIPTSTTSASTSSNSNSNAQSKQRDVAKADAFANLVVFIWFSSWPMLTWNQHGTLTPSNKSQSPKSTFQPLQSSPLASSRYTQSIHSQNQNQSQSQSQPRSFTEPVGPTNPIGNPPNASGISNQIQAHQGQQALSQSNPYAPPQESDHFATSVKRALEEHLSTSSSNQSGPSGRGGGGIGANSQNAASSNNLDSDSYATQRLLPHHRFKTFARDVLTTTQASGPGMALALLFIYRLKSAHPHLKGKEGSEFRIAITALMLSNKALEDHTFTNKSWSEISGIELKDVNKMEIEFWLGLGMSINASVDEYQQWLVTLRSLEERRAHALIKRERDINRKKLAQHHAAIAALQQQQQQQQYQKQQSHHSTSQSQQCSPQHLQASPQDHGYPTPPLLPHPVINNPRPNSSSGLLQPSSYSHLPPQLGVRTSNLGPQQQNLLNQHPTWPSTSSNPPKNFIFPFSNNFNFNTRSSEALNQEDREEESPLSISPINNGNLPNPGPIDLSSYQLQPKRLPSSSSGSALLSASNSRFHSPERSLSVQHLHSQQQFQTPLSDSRRQSNASSQGSNSISSVKRAFGAMQTGSVSPHHSNGEEDQDRRSDSVGPPPSKRMAAGLGLLKPGRNVAGDDWEWMSNGNAAATTASHRNSMGNLDGFDGTPSSDFRERNSSISIRSSISPTNELHQNHSRYSSFPMDEKFRSSAQSQISPYQGDSSQCPTWKNNGSSSHHHHHHPQQQQQHQHSSSNPYQLPNPCPHPHQVANSEDYVQSHQRQPQQQHQSIPSIVPYPQLLHQQISSQSIRTPNMLAKPYNDYDLNSRPQPTELVFYQISASNPDRKIYGTQPAPPLTEWEYANSRRGSYAAGFGTPIPGGFMFTSATGGSCPSPNLAFGTSTPMGMGGHGNGNASDSPSVSVSPSSSIQYQHQYQHSQSQASQINRNNFYSHNHYNNHNQSWKDHHQPHPLSRTTSPIATTSKTSPSDSIRDQSNQSHNHNFDLYNYAKSRPLTQHRSSLSDSSILSKFKTDADQQQGQEVQVGNQEGRSRKSINVENNHDVFSHGLDDHDP